MTKRKSKPDVDTTAVFDNNGLTDQYLQTMTAALPSGVEPPESLARTRDRSSRVSSPARAPNAPAAQARIRTLAEH